MQSTCAAYYCHLCYCHLWPVWLYEVFPHYLIKGMIFGKELLNIKCVSRTSLQLTSETFFTQVRVQRNIIINLYTGLMSNTRYSCQIPMKLEFSKQIFEENSNIKFHENPSSGRQVVQRGRTDGRTDRHERNNRFSKYCQSARKI